MFAPKWRKGSLILFALVLLGAWAFQGEALARVGGGRSMGSRGSRSASPPRSFSAPRPTQPSRPSVTPAPRPTTPPASGTQPGSFWRSFGGGLLGGLAGGLLFHSLLGAPAAHGAPGTGYSGVGLLDILLLAGIAYLIFWYVKKKRQEAVAEGPYQTSATLEPPSQPGYQQPAYHDQLSSPDQDLEQGLAHLRQFDPAFDEQEFRDRCLDLFFKIQGAWANRDLAPVKNLLTDEMYRLLQADAERLKAEKQVNRLENIAVRAVDITEAWQEAGQDYITARVYANLLDYTVDENTGEVLSGSQTDPVKFEEYWTLTRPVGSNPWQLSAIQQAG
jgi:predicted lipid-binding transport protein (Tim44 family)